MYFKPLGEQSSLPIKSQCADIYVEYLNSRGIKTDGKDPFEVWQRASSFLMNYYVQSESKVLAIGSFSINRELQSAMLHNIVVRSSDTRNGVGRFLVDRLEREITVAGISRVDLNSTYLAIPFYEALGYQRDGLSSNYFYKNL